MDANEIIRLPDPRRNVRAEVREVVHDVDERPHVFWRVRLTGWSFPHRGPEPFLLVGDAVSRFVVIAPDGSIADAYFDKPLPDAKRVSFGYGKIVSWDFDVAIAARVRRLDRARLPKGVVDAFRPEEIG
ncbi:MAG: hypothetical protein QOF60_579 [Actinomycetota bacterium]|jgi:hypothetical protein|nr:hypothetical protein [Actinomycetota bacterium]